MEISPIVLIDPTNFMMKNVSTNAYQIGHIQSIFYDAFKKLETVKDRFEKQVFKKLSPETTVRKDFLNSYYEENYQEELVLGKNLDLLETCLGLKMTDETNNSTLKA